MKKKLLIPLTVLVLLSVTLLTGCCFHKKTAATCTEAEVCEKCGEVFSEPTGHNFKEATCTEPETCINCGLTQGPVAPHPDFTGATCTEKGVCTDCGAAAGATLGHDFAPATCTEPKTCERCGDTTGKALGHNIKYAGCNEEGTCTRCGEGSGDTRDHKYEDATCTYAEKCVYCNETVGEPLGHDFSEATCTEQKQCNRCGASEGEPLGHKYENNVCVRCGEIDPDSLPVGLETVHVIDSGCYEFVDSVVTDSFGYTYDSSHKYSGNGREAILYSVHNLDKKYSNISFSIVADKNTLSDTNATIEIYIDGKLAHNITEYGKTTGKIDLSFDVKNCTKFEIKMDFITGNWNHSTIHIVNAELTK